jgi:hypothetical protein
MSPGAAVGQPMGKERNPATASVKIDPELLRKARQVVAFLEQGGEPVKLAEYLDSLLRESIERDHAALMERLRQAKPKKDGGTP